eukprot:NODE_6864_length_617_cov_48.220408_g6841_i0.p1 GENE.NODE_6864_length_617_cov_48.220408_g6841_i0~~NODE_6864_length_617_cov_48.220408_g6841_i0.p1  ORF type:complete len:146 (-),score=32.20 NODE_6864_length_617_cov_48.220408_g6841_i0:76-513(-)
MSAQDDNGWGDDAVDLSAAVSKASTTKLTAETKPTAQLSSKAKPFVPSFTPQAQSAPQPALVQQPDAAWQQQPQSHSQPELGDDMENYLGQYEEDLLRQEMGAADYAAYTQALEAGDDDEAKDFTDQDYLEFIQADKAGQKFPSS